MDLERLSLTQGPLMNWKGPLMNWKGALELVCLMKVDEMRLQVEL